MNEFDFGMANDAMPLAERLRLQRLADVVGQEGLIGPKGRLRRMPDAGTFVHKQGPGMAMLYAGVSLCLSLGSFTLCCWLVRMPS